MIAMAQVSSPRHAARRGFTLIELLVVMAILGLLLGIALPNYQASVARARDTVLKENLRVLRASIQAYRADTGHYPAALGVLVERRYLTAMPVDPITASARTWIEIPAEADDADGLTQAVPGIADVRSGAKGSTAAGQPYDSL